MSHEFSRLCGFQGFKARGFEGSKLQYFSVNGKPIYLKAVLNGHCLEYREATNVACKPFNGRHAEVRQKRTERASELLLRRSAKSSAAISFGWIVGCKVYKFGLKALAATRLIASIISFVFREHTLTKASMPKLQ